MTDQTKWGIDLVQVKNKAIKYQKDLVSRAMEQVMKMDESGITDLMLLIEAEYERKYGKNVSDKMVL
jgi:regulator of protease activity HflC (stomatin/prohibitin superfamily)